MAFKSIQASAKQSLLDYFVSGKAVQYHSAEKGFRADLQGLTATGGVISDYTDGATVYRAHIFTSSGTFDVTAPGTFGDTVDYLVVAGGGGGGAVTAGSGYAGGGGGGAGGFRTNIPGYPAAGSTYPVTVSPYSIIVGAGGAGGSGGVAVNGTQSVFDNGGPNPIASVGGGYGAINSSAPDTDPSFYGNPGGSGGGASGRGNPTPGGSGYNYPGPTQQGFPGSPSPSNTGGGPGGGGAGGAGSTFPPSPDANGGAGGIGYPSIIAGPQNDGIGTPGPNPGRYFAGGGGGGGYSNSGGAGGAGGAGGGANGSGPAGGPNSGLSATGGGGGGAENVTRTSGGNGGSGIVVVRYQIAQLTATAKATGGAISYFGGKTIHTFVNSGTFQTTSAIPSAEYLVVAGGGSGGVASGYFGTDGGGGGGGGFRTNVSGHPLAPGSGPLAFTSPNTYTITVGAGGAGGKLTGSTPSQGIPSSISGPDVTTITSVGGGGGGGEPPAYSPDNWFGGSGGGGGGDDPTAGVAANPSTPAPLGGPYATTQGYPGGNLAGPAAEGGGGGGAGGAGTAGGPTGGGPGGNGSPISISGSAVTYAGGGGGAPGGSGGSGGGGAASTGAPNGVDGIQSTGGGGGGASVNDASRNGNGGSGIVLIAYPS